MVEAAPEAMTSEEVLAILSVVALLLLGWAVKIGRAGSQKKAARGQTPAASWPKTLPTKSERLVDVNEKLFGFDAKVVAEFDVEYWFSFDPRIQALAKLDPASRYGAAMQLAQKGLPIDHDIMVLGADPYITMYVRTQQGYTWVPNALQPNVLTPGDHFPGTSDYDAANPPVGSLKVSTKLEDFPPFPEPPAPPAPLLVPSGFVGRQVLFGSYVANQKAVDAFKAGTLKDGDTISQDGKSYMFHTINSNGGFYFTQV